MTRNERNAAIVAAMRKKEQPALVVESEPKTSHSGRKRAKRATNAPTHHKSKHTPLVDGGICESHMKGAK